MSAASIHWDLTMTAVSSIAHGGETRGTITLLRREAIRQDDGQLVHVPIVSGNSFRGRLRRIGEELLRDELGYDGQLDLPAAHALRGGGALAKTGREPLSGARLARLRFLVPQLAVFGAAAGSRTMPNPLKVGKLVPHFAEARPALPPEIHSDLLTAFTATQIETYTRLDDRDHPSFPAIRAELGPDGYPDLDESPADTGDEQTMLMLYRIETLPIGTRLSGWLRLDRATPIEVSFFTEILDHFTQSGFLGGRTSRGHGQVKTEAVSTTIHGDDQSGDWRHHVRTHRDEALAALRDLT